MSKHHLSTWTTVWIAALACSACKHPEGAEPAPSSSKAAVPAAPEHSAVTKQAEPEPASVPDARISAAGQSSPSATAWLGKTKADIVSIESALENYAINNSMRYPDSLVPLITPDVNGATYLRRKEMLVDPWDRAYVYDPPELGRPNPRIYTLGRDGLPGGIGEDADVDNESIRNE